MEKLAISFQPVLRVKIKFNFLSTFGTNGRGKSKNLNVDDVSTRYTYGKISKKSRRMINIIKKIYSNYFTIKSDTCTRGQDIPALNITKQLLEFAFYKKCWICFRKKKPEISNR